MNNYEIYIMAGLIWGLIFFSSPTVGDAMRESMEADKLSGNSRAGFIAFFLFVTIALWPVSILITMGGKKK